MRITVVGLGYVGLANALLLAQQHELTGIDISEEKITKLKSGMSPIDDKEITEYLSATTVTFTTNFDEAKNAELFIIATPTDYLEETKYFNTLSVDSVIAQIISHNKDALILIKSTIPIGYVETMRKKHKTKNIIFSPEFLREGSALFDNLYPSRIIVGDKTKNSQIIADLFANAAKNKPKIIMMGPNEAEATKLFSNTFLACRVAFFNELDSFCMHKNLNSKDIICGMSLDSRIGDIYNNPSFGFGGYCLPKDTRQLLADYSDIPQNLIGAIVDSNLTRKKIIADAVLNKKPRTVGVYRLAMKSGSDNSRFSAILDIIGHLKQANVNTIIYDPSLKAESYHGITVVDDLAYFKENSDVILTNRHHIDLKDVSDKIFTRDIFGYN